MPFVPRRGRSRYAGDVTETTATAPTLKDSGRPRWLDFGLLIAVVPIVLAAARIVLYSGGDPVLMRVLIETLNVTTLLLGTILPMLPLLFWLALQPLIADASLTRQLLTKRAPSRNWWLLLLIAFPALYVLVGPWPDSLRGLAYLAGALALGACTVWVFGVLRERRRGARWRHALRVRLTWGRGPVTGDAAHVLIVPVVLLLVIFAVPRGFWLPLESVTVDSQEVRGYVLQVEDGWATVLTEDRGVERYPAASMTARDICDQGEYESLITVIAGGTAPPASGCP